MLRASACVIGMLSVAPAALAAELSETGEFVDGVAAIVNDGVVLKSQLREEMSLIMRRAQDQGFQLPPANVLQEQVLERLILTEIQLQRANQIGLAVSDQMLNDSIARMAQQAGIPFDQMPAALAADAMAETFLACHAKKLPREQWAMFELARLAAEVETAVILARKAVVEDGGRLELLIPCARLHGGAAARDVGVTGLRLLRASSRYEPTEVEAWCQAVRFNELLATADGELEEMNRVASALERG